MALKPTIYKFNLSISDLNRDYYDTFSLTVAQHPSETSERMMARMLAYSLNAQEFLSFTKGLSSPDEPDISLHRLDGQLDLWIDVGEPAFDRIKKASRLAKQVKIYSFNSKSSVWWQQSHAQMNALAISVIQFQWEDMQRLAELIDRTVTMSMTISGDTVYVSADKGECEIAYVALQGV